MTTVCHPESGKVTASFAAVARHYGVQVAICPPRRGNRKGVVEKSNHTAAQRWWRTLGDDVTVEEAQASAFHADLADTTLRNAKVPVLLGKLGLAKVQGHQESGHFRSEA